MLPRLIPILAVALLTACAPTQPIANRVTFDNPEFSKLASLYSSEAAETEPGEYNFLWSVHASLEKATRRVTAYSIRVDTIYYGTFLRFERAYDEQGSELPVHVDFQRKIDVNIRSERLDVVVSEAFLRKRIDTGFRIRLASRQKYGQDIAITPKQIRELLDAAAQYKATGAIPDAAPASPK